MPRPGSLQHGKAHSSLPLTLRRSNCPQCNGTGFTFSYRPSVTNPATTDRFARRCAVCNGMGSVEPVAPVSGGKMAAAGERDDPDPTDYSMLAVIAAHRPARATTESSRQLRARLQAITLRQLRSLKCSVGGAA